MPSKLELFSARLSSLPNFQSLRNMSNNFGHLYNPSQDDDIASLLTAERVVPAFRGLNRDFARTAPKKRTRVRHPIIINGAGPAGFILVIG